jgi:hypothetical protein
MRMYPGELLVGDGERVAAVTDGTATIGGVSRRWSTVGLYRIVDSRIAECWLLPLNPVPGVEREHLKSRTLATERARRDPDRGLVRCHPIRPGQCAGDRTSRRHQAGWCSGARAGPHTSTERQLAKEDGTDSYSIGRSCAATWTLRSRKYIKIV